VAPAPFEALSTAVEGVRVISVRGELDLNTAPDLEGQLEPALASGESLIIDLDECEFIDSTGIALIVRAWQRIDTSDGGARQLAIAGANDQVQRVLEISGLDHSIPVHESRDEGLAALRGAASA
jgi:anti-anti-sigma factor